MHIISTRRLFWAALAVAAVALLLGHAVWPRNHTVTVYQAVEGPASADPHSSNPAPTNGSLTVTNGSRTNRLPASASPDTTTPNRAPHARVPSSRTTDHIDQPSSADQPLIDDIAVRHNGAVTHCGGGVITLSVRAGDTLFKLVARVVTPQGEAITNGWVDWDGATRVIGQFNHLANINLVRVGQKLKLPEWCTSVLDR